MKNAILSVILFLFALPVFSQNQSAASTKLAGYASIIHPIFSVDKNTTTYNFSDSYTVGIPVGLNLLKGEKVGLSFELAPYIRFEDESAKVSFFLFHPGVLFKLQHGFSIVTRLAFETTGRFGATPVFTKVFLKGENVSYFISPSLPIRTGNGKPASFGLAVSLGCSF